MTDDALGTMLSVTLAAMGAFIAWGCTLPAVSNTDLSKKDQTIVIVCVTLTIFVVVFVSTYVWFTKEVLMCSN